MELEKSFCIRLKTEQTNLMLVSMGVHYVGMWCLFVVYVDGCLLGKMKFIFEKWHRLISNENEFLETHFPSSFNHKMDFRYAFISKIVTN